MTQLSGGAWKAKARHLVLLALNDGKKHGYEITKHVQQASEGYFSIGYSSLYPALHALEKEGLIAGKWQAQGAKEKKVYELTDQGTASLADLTEEYQGFIRAFQLMLEGRNAHV